MLENCWTPYFFLPLEVEKCYPAFPTSMWTGFNSRGAGKTVTTICIDRLQKKSKIQHTNQRICTEFKSPWNDAIQNIPSLIFEVAVFHIRFTSISQFLYFRYLFLFVYASQSFPPLLLSFSCSLSPDSSPLFPLFPSPLSYLCFILIYLLLALPQHSWRTDTPPLRAQWKTSQIGIINNGRKADSWKCLWHCRYSPGQDNISR